MPETSVFDRLVSDLSLAERRALLERVRASVVMSSEPLSVPRESEERYDVDRAYRGLHFFQKLFLFIKAFIKRKDPLYIVQDSLIDSLAKEVERSCPGIFSYRTLKFLPGFAEEIETLRESLSLFTEPLRKALGKEKRDFVAFLGGLEVPEIQEQLLAASDPRIHIERRGDPKDDLRLKRDMEMGVSEILQDIPREVRERIFNHARSVSYLNSLVFFPYSRILGKFKSGVSSGGCAAEEIRPPLVELFDILSGFAAPPTLSLLEGLFIFNFQDRLESNQIDLGSELSEITRDAERCISQIRSFNRRIPLVKILKVITRNINYQPQPPKGGEDWFHLFRQFWEKRLEDAFQEFVFSRRSEELLRDAQNLLGGTTIPFLKYYRSGIWGEDVTVRFEVTAAFLRQFLLNVFHREMDTVVTIFLREGSFYKSQNKRELEDAFDVTASLAQRIQDADLTLSPDGAQGRIIAALKLEKTGIRDKQRKITAILGEADRDVNVIIRLGIDNLLILVNIIRGIIYGEVGGQYDSISNIGFIGGKENENLVMRLGTMLKKAEIGQRLLGDLYDLEVRR